MGMSEHHGPIQDFSCKLTLGVKKYWKSADWIANFNLQSLVIANFKLQSIGIEIIDPQSIVIVMDYDVQSIVIADFDLQLIM